MAQHERQAPAAVLDRMTRWELRRVDVGGDEPDVVLAQHDGSPSGVQSLLDAVLDLVHRRAPRDLRHFGAFAGAAAAISGQGHARGPRLYPIDQHLRAIGLGRNRRWVAQQREEVRSLLRELDTWVCVLYHPDRPTVRMREPLVICLGSDDDGDPWVSFGLLMQAFLGPHHEPWWAESAVAADTAQEGP